MTTGSFALQRSSMPGLVVIDAVSDRVFARHTHESFGIGLLRDGAQKSWSGRGLVEAERGDVITVNPGEVHDGMPIGSSRAWSMLYIAPDRVADMVHDITDGKHASRELHAPVLRDRRIAALFRRARAAVEADVDASLTALFGAILAPSTMVPAVSPAFARVRQRIDDDPLNAPDLAELAALSGLSRYATLRGFRRMTGMTPHDYLTQRRLDIARMAIRGGAGLADAAIGAGFADQSHFHRAFTARYGMTPGVLATA